MSKMAEIAQTIEELRTAASINAAANKLSEIDPTNYEALLQDAEVIGNGS